jgi:hypothetical protein
MAGRRSELPCSTGVAWGWCGLGGYSPAMSTSPLSPDDIRAAAEVHAELGPEYRDAVVESFLAKIDNEISARIDARLAATPRARRRDSDPVAAARRRGVATGLVLGTIVTGVPLTSVAVYIGNNAHWIAWQSKLWLFWAVMAIVYGAGAAAFLAWNRRQRQSAGRPQRDGERPGSSRGGRATRVIPRHS